MSRAPPGDGVLVSVTAPGARWMSVIIRLGFTGRIARGLPRPHPALSMGRGSWGFLSPVALWPGRALLLRFFNPSPWGTAF